jgi:hypothetical protein
MNRIDEEKLKGEVGASTRYVEVIGKTLVDTFGSDGAFGHAAALGALVYGITMFKSTGGKRDQLLRIVGTLFDRIKLMAPAEEATPFTIDVIEEKPGN